MSLHLQNPIASTSQSLLLSDKSTDKLEFVSTFQPNDFIITHKFGYSSFVQGFQATHIQTGEQCFLQKIYLGASLSESGRKPIFESIRSHMEIKSRYFVKIYGCFDDGEFCWIVKEFYHGNSVKTLLSQNYPKLTNHISDDSSNDPEVEYLSEKAIPIILSNVLHALSYTASQNIIHSNIRASTILLSLEGDAFLDESTTLMTCVADVQGWSDPHHSVRWMAPEYLVQEGSESPKSDIWSLGITAIEMVQGKSPYEQENTMRAIIRIIRDPPPELKNPDKYSANFRDFVHLCLLKNPDDRPSAEELLGHPFIASSDMEASRKLLVDQICEFLSSKSVPTHIIPIADPHTNPSGRTASCSSTTQPSGSKGTVTILTDPDTDTDSEYIVWDRSDVIPNSNSSEFSNVSLLPPPPANIAVNPPVNQITNSGLLFHITDLDTDTDTECIEWDRSGALSS